MLLWKEVSLFVSRAVVQLMSAGAVPPAMEGKCVSFADEGVQLLPLPDESTARASAASGYGRVALLLGGGYLRRRVYGRWVAGDVFIIFVVAAVLGLTRYLPHLDHAGLDGEIKDASVGCWACWLLFFAGVDYLLTLHDLQPSSPFTLSLHVFCTICGFAACVLFEMGMEHEIAIAFSLFCMASWVSFLAGSTPSPEIKGIKKKVFGRWDLPTHTFGLLALTLLLVLMTTYASICAEWIVYPPRGKFVSAGPYTILTSCEGPVSEKPTIIIDADGSHGAADFWPLQREFVRLGRRMCIFSKPGLEYSQNYQSQQNLFDVNNFMVPLLDSLGEKPPFALVGWGGGGSNVINYAMAQRDHVASLTFLDSYRPNLEWRTYQMSANASLPAVIEYRNKTLSSRFSMFDLIRYFAVPLGFVRLFLSNNVSQYSWPERYAEYHRFYFLSKTWTTQYYTLKAMHEHGETGDGDSPLSVGKFVEGQPPLFGALPVLNVLSRPPDEVLCRDLSPQECAKRVKEEDFGVRDGEVLARTLSSQGRAVYCREADCNLGMPLQKSSWVARVIVQNGV